MWVKKLWKKIPSGVWVGLSYLLLSIFFTYPLVRHFASAILGPAEDNQQFFWNLWWFRESLMRGDNPFVTNFLFFPTGTNLYLHTLSPLNSLLGIVLQWFMNLSAAYNTLVLFSLVLSGISMYYLTLDIIGDKRAAWLAGLIFTFAPRHVAHIFHHLSIIGIQYIPFFILTLRRVWQGRSPYLNAFLAALAAVATFYTDFYNALYLTVFGIIFIGYQVLRDRQEIGKKIGATALMVIVATALVAPLVYPVIQEKLSGAYPEKGWDLYGADLAAFIVPPSYHWLVGPFVTPWYEKLGLNNWEATHYVGFTVLILVIIGGWHCRRELYFWLGTGLLFLVLSFGSTLHVWGMAFGNYWPYYWLIQRMPILNLAKTAGRFSIFMVVALALAAAFGAKVLLTRWQWRYGQRGAVVGLAALVILILIEFTPGSVALTKTVAPAIYTEITTDPTPGAVIDIPMGSWQAGEEYMALQITHGRPIAGGTISRARSDVYAAAMQFQYTHDYLQKAQFRYLILHKKYLVANEVMRWQEKVERGGLKKIFDDASLTVYRID